MTDAVNLPSRVRAMYDMGMECMLAITSGAVRLPGCCQGEACNIQQEIQMYEYK